MQDENKPTETPAPNEEKKTEETPKTFTQEELEKTLSERLKREREKADKALAEKLKAEREDWERQAKLSAEEKEAETRKKEAEKTAAREREITLRENRADARELLQEKNISADLVDFVVDVDPDKTKENIDSLEKVFLKAVEAGVNERLKGDTPKDKSTKTETTQYSGTTVI